MSICILSVLLCILADKIIQNRSARAALWWLAAASVERSRFLEEQIIGILKELEAGVSVAVSDAGIFKWKAKFGGLALVADNRSPAPAWRVNWTGCRPRQRPWSTACKMGPSSS
jgi:hypothetical protein